MGIINKSEWVDVNDLSAEAKDAYQHFVRGCVLHNGEHWSFEVGETGDDSVVESWIGEEACGAINKSLIANGLAEGAIIDLVFSW